MASITGNITLKERIKAKVTGKDSSPANLPEHHPTPSRPTFINPYGCKHIAKSEVARAMFFKKFASVPLPDEENLLPVHVPDWGEGKQGLKATWLGHASWLIEFPVAGSARGVRVLTDPIWSKRSSPVAFVGPKRYRDTPCSIADLPEVDAICISHNHYDHCDARTIKEIYVKQEKHAPAIFVPLGVRSLMVSKCSAPENSVAEMDWWDEQNLSINILQQGEEKFVFTCTPAQHGSGRGIHDINKTLWCSWAIHHVNSDLKVYFAGDTGYRTTHGGDPNPSFKKIGQVCGPFNLGLIPIGNYAPENLMAPVHCTPKEAIEIHNDIRSQRSLAMHWGTRHAGMSRYYMDAMEPKKEFIRQREEMLGGDCEKFDVCEIGETVIVKQHLSAM